MWKGARRARLFGGQLNFGLHGRLIIAWLVRCPCEELRRFESDLLVYFLSLFLSWTVS